MCNYGNVPREVRWSVVARQFHVQQSASIVNLNRSNALLCEKDVQSLLGSDVHGYKQNGTRDREPISYHWITHQASVRAHNEEEGSDSRFLKGTR